MAQKRKSKITTPNYPESCLEIEPVTQHHTRTDIQQVIKDCLQRCSKDGLALGRIENSFW